ncbi:MAG: glycosyltransferase family 39 protein, partial [Chloroflexota bacterium]
MIQSSGTHEDGEMKPETFRFRDWLVRNRGLAWAAGIALMLLLALLIRLVAITWGLPNQAYYHSLFVPDETSELIASLMLGERAYQYPLIRLQPFFYYLTFIYFSLYFFISLATGRVTNWAEYIAWQRQDLAHFILVGRVFMVFLGVLTVYLTFLVARRMFGKRAGLISAAILFLSIGHVTYSRVFRLDSLMPFMTILAFYAFLRMLYGQDERLRWYVLAGFVVAATAATKLTGFALLGPLLLIPFLNPEGKSAWPLRRPVFSRQYVFALFVCLASYIMIAGPSHVIRLQITYGGDLSQAPRSVLGLAGRFNRAETFRKIGGLSTFDVSLPFHLTSSLPRLLGITSYLSALAGMGFMVFER